jgi:ribosome-associated protein
LSQNSGDMADLVVEFITNKKGQGILVMDLRGITDIADCFVICSGSSDTQVKAIADSVIEGMEGSGYRPWHVEGYEGRKWVLVDFIDVVVHIFLEDTRNYYSLERLWGDAKIEKIEEEVLTFEGRSETEGKDSEG